MFKNLFNRRRANHQSGVPPTVPTKNTDPCLLPSKFNLPLCKLPGGYIGVIDHIKENGQLGVRPLDPRGEFLPNQSWHWNEADRAKFPHEIVLDATDLKPVPANEVPKFARIFYTA